MKNLKESKIEERCNWQCYAVAICCIAVIFVKIWLLESTVPFTNEQILTSSFQSSKTKANYNYRQNNTPPPILWKPCGRLGNQLFQYTFLYCTAKILDRTPVVPRNSNLLKLFDNITAQRVDPIVPPYNLPSKDHVGAQGARYNQSIIDKIGNNNQSWIKGFFLSWKYFNECEHDLRLQLVINSTLQEIVYNDMRNMAATYITEKNISFGEITFVGVHVRRGDRLKQKYLDSDKGPAPLSYIKHAIAYYNNKYKWPLFIIASEGIDWCKDNIKSKKNNLIFSNYSAAMFMFDFSLLASCNHSIITIGSFGWFAGWIAGGEVVYYKKWTAFRGDPSDYYLPEWKGMV